MGAYTMLFEYMNNKNRLKFHQKLKVYDNATVNI